MSSIKTLYTVPVINDIRYYNKKNKVSSKLSNEHQTPIVDHLVHYRNMFAAPEFFIRRKVDYSKMRVCNEKYRKETERTKTFCNFPPEKKHLINGLVKSGFFYAENLSVPDQVKCIFCQGMLHDWLSNDIPMRRHKHSYPTCPFIISLNVGNDASNGDMLKSPNLDPDMGNGDSIDCVILAGRLDRHCIDEDIYHFDFDWREKTFENQKKIKSLAQEGLFVTKKCSESFLRCCWCERSTEILDHVEHLRGALFHKDSCQRGVAIDEVGDTGKSEGSKDFCDIEYAVTAQEIEARTETNLVYQSIAAGFGKASKEDIKAIIERRLKEQGKDFGSLYEFLKAVKERGDPRAVPPRGAVCAPGGSAVPMTAVALSEYQCVVCLDRTVEIIFLPCGHLKTCESCSSAMVTCPVCRVVIERRVRNMRFNEVNNQ